MTYVPESDKLQPRSQSLVIETLGSCSLFLKNLLQEIHCIVVSI